MNSDRLLRTSALTLTSLVNRSTSLLTQTTIALRATYTRSYAHPFCKCLRFCSVDFFSVCSYISFVRFYFILSKVWRFSFSWFWFSFSFDDFPFTKVRAGIYFSLVFLCLLSAGNRILIFPYLNSLLGVKDSSCLFCCCSYAL